MKHISVLTSPRPRDGLVANEDATGLVQPSMPVLPTQRSSSDGARECQRACLGTRCKWQLMIMTQTFMAYL